MTILTPEQRDRLDAIRERDADLPLPDVPMLPFQQAAADRRFLLALLSPDTGDRLDVERLLDAVRAYGDARADVAYGRATRRAIDHAWDQMLAAARIPPMDTRLAATEPEEGA